MIVLDGVTHVFPGQPEPVLTNVDLRIPAGVSVALTGASGSGKSTLLSIIGHYVTPTSGRAFVRSGSGEEVGRRQREHFSWVVQGNNALLGRTATDNVAVSLLALGIHRSCAEVAARNALEGVGLGHRADARARTLSGGELQRVNIARALASGRPYVLADEPTGQLDKRNTDAVTEVLMTSVRDDRSIVISTHDLDLAQRCDTIIHLVNGRAEVAA